MLKHHPVNIWFILVTITLSPPHEEVVMPCPVCGGQAVVARTHIPQLVDKVQEGRDPYDLIYDDHNQAECLTCGHVFDSDPARSSTGNQGVRDFPGNE
jgi:hypothetical protein